MKFGLNQCTHYHLCQGCYVFVGVFCLFVLARLHKYSLCFNCHFPGEPV